MKDGFRRKTFGLDRMNEDFPSDVYVHILRCLAIALHSRITNLPSLVHPPALSLCVSSLS